MILPEAFIAAFILGLMGAGHCLGMCGGIVSALALAIPESSLFKRSILLIAYNFGRVFSYTAMGGIAGYMGSRIPRVEGLPVLQIVSALLLVAMGLYLARWWTGLSRLEALGSHLWRYIQPLATKLMPVSRWYEAVCLGALWGWLPCGLVYSALAYSASQSDALAGGGVMLGFGLGTLPAVFAGGLLANQLNTFINKPWIRGVAGLGFIAYGLWLLVSLLFLGAGDAHDHHHHHHH